MARRTTTPPQSADMLNLAQAIEIMATTLERTAKCYYGITTSGCPSSIRKC